MPKGNPIKGLTAHAAAAHEAFEEAGLIGTVAEKSVGSFRYLKLRSSGRNSPVTVQLFALAVSGQAENWPERDEREFRWFNLPAAASAVVEPELKALITGFEVRSCNVPLS